VTRLIRDGRRGRTVRRGGSGEHCMAETATQMGGIDGAKQPAGSSAYSLGGRDELRAIRGVGAPWLGAGFIVDGGAVRG
jgi:hypothetical protein